MDATRKSSDGPPPRSGRGFGAVPHRREHILGFDRLTGIEIADLADRLVEIWPQDGGELDAIAEVRERLDDLAVSTDRLAQIVIDLRTELERIERLPPR